MLAMVKLRKLSIISEQSIEDEWISPSLHVEQFFQQEII